MRRLLTCVLLLNCVGAAAWAQNANDVLYLQDGRERVGELVKLDAEQVVFWLRGESAAATFARGEVERVDLSRKRAGDDARTVAELKDPLLNRLLQSPPTKAAYPDSGHVVLYWLYDYKLEADGSYTLTERCIEKVLLERGKDEANVVRYYLKGEETLNVDFARTINPDGSITPISDAAVSINSLHANTPEYEKQYELKFAMKQVREESLLDYQVTKRRPKTDLLYPFYATRLLRDEEPILEAELRIDVPQSVELAVRTDRLGKNVEITREAHGDRVVHRYVAKQCPRVVPESLMPPARDFYPRITAALQADWAAIGSAFQKALLASAVASEDIRGKVQELTTGVNQPAERARRIYHYFIQTVHQLHVPPYQYSYVPHSAGEVFARRAGNSLDKAVLLMVMLNEAGLDAGVVLACPQYSGKIVEDVPCIRQFEDAVVAVTLPTGRQFLAVTDEAVRFGQMPSQYQGTRGLLVARQGSELVEIPLNPPEDEATAIDYQMRVLPTGDLAVTKVETLAGNSEVGRRHAWKNLKDEELRRNLEEELTGVHAQAHLEDYAVENLQDVTQPLKFTEKYTVSNYALKVGSDLLVFQLPEVSYGAAQVGKPTRDFPLHWRQRSKSVKTMQIAVPAGFRVYYAGRNWSADVDSSSFRAEFAAAEHEVSYRDEFVQKAIDAPAEKYGEYKSCIETMARVPKEWIVLERVAE